MCVIVVVYFIFCSSSDADIVVKYMCNFFCIASNSVNYYLVYAKTFYVHLFF